MSKQKTGKIALIVDDDLDWQRYLKKTCEDAGYGVEIVATLGAALDSISDRQYSVCILDMNLDDSSIGKWANFEGKQFLDYIKSAVIDLEVIVVSGFTSQTDVRNLFKNYNIHDFVFKRDYSPRKVKQILLDLDKHVIERLIESGETEIVEFKSSVKWDYNRGEPNKNLYHAIVKSITAFMNSDGGQLLIGVDDDGNIIGLSKDYATFERPGRDQYKQHITNLISDNIGKEYSDLVVVSICQINEADVCLVKVRRSSEPVYAKDGEDFFIRSGNTVRQLNPIEIVSYNERHWGIVR